MNYDAMSVEELVDCLVCERSNFHFGEPLGPIEDMTVALRKACIREASVRVGEIGRHWVGEDEGGRFTQVVRTKNDAGEEEDIEEGDYDLIPHKEES